MSKKNPQELLKAILEDPDVVEKLDYEETEQVRRLINPYMPIDAEQFFVNASVINLRETYQKRLMMTALIGYLFRCLNEWDPRDDLPPTNDMTEGEVRAYRAIVKMFLNRNFCYNPDIHVRGAHREGRASVERMRVYREPPAEVFYQFSRYLDSNYESLRDAVNELYVEKPDIEYGVVLYSRHDTEEEAKKWVVAHEKDFRWDVLTISSGVTFLGPFKQNREKLDFYGKNGQLLQDMLEQAERDHKIGNLLMQNRVKKHKRRDVARMGPDAAGLKSYIGTMSSGVGNRVLTDEELKEIEGSVKTEKAVRVTEEFDDLPENAIVCPMYVPEEDEKGEFKLKKSEFYSKVVDEAEKK